MHGPVNVAAIIVLSCVPELHTGAAVDLGIPRQQNISSLYPTAFFGLCLEGNRRTLFVIIPALFLFFLFILLPVTLPFVFIKKKKKNNPKPT